jgi:hypothetical protein
MDENITSPKKKELLIKSKIIKKKKNMSKTDINNERNERIAKIMENDIVANEKVVDEYNEYKFSWEDDFFKKFEWLSDSLEQGPNENDITYQDRYNLFMDCCKILEDEMIQIQNEPDIRKEVEYNKLYMYFVSLESDKLFLYTDFKMDYESVMKTCEDNYEYVQKYKPRKIIFTVEINDLYDVDKYVKTFMHMFGIDETRGGSYTACELPEYLKEAIAFEKNITTIDFYLKKK